MFIHKSGYFFGDASKLWWIFIIAGIFALVSPYLIELNVSHSRIIIIGSVTIFIGLTLKLNYFGLQIDTTKKGDCLNLLFNSSYSVSNLLLA